MLRFIPTSPRAKIASLLVAFIAMLCLSLWLFVQAKRLAGETARQVVQYIEARTGLAIDFKSHDIGLGTVEVEEVQIRQPSTSTIGSISAELNLNPFHGTFGKPDRVRVRLVKAKMPYRQFKDDFLVKFAKGMRAPHPEAAAVATKALATMKDLLNHPLLPQVMMVENATFIFTDEANRDLLTLNDANFTYDRQRGILKFSVDAMSYRQQRLLEKVSGDISIAAAGDAYPFQLSYKDAAGKQQWRTRGTLLKDLSGLSFFVKNRGLPKDLEPLFGKYLVDPSQFRYAAKVNIFARKDGEGFAFGTQIASTNLKVKHPLIGSDPVGPMPIRLRAYGQFSPEDGSFAIHEGSVTLKKLGATDNATSPVIVHFSLHKDDLFDMRGHLPWHFKINLPPTTCQSVLDNAPPGLMPKLSRFHVLGDLSLAMDISVHPAMPQNFDYRLTEGRFNCQVIDAPYLMSRDRLLSANPLDLDMRRVAEDPDLYVPLPRAYVTLDQVPEYFYKSLIVAEDAGFWFHKGFAWEAIENALRHNLSEREVTVGGSTISMQTAKNLFLDQKRTLTRKLQEIFLTWYLERQVSKRKILEIYMNIIDYGPEVKGIVHASRHFFDKEPKDLSVAEAAYLATVLPSPAKRYRNYCEGKVGNLYRPVVQKNLERLLAMDAITMPQFAAASRDPIDFHRPVARTAGCETMASGSSPFISR